MARKLSKSIQSSAVAPNNLDLPSQSGSRGTPLVFISHDSRDADLAAAFDNLLTDASGGVIQTFRSSDQSGKAGIEYGENWYSKIAERLADASDVVALLTPNSTGRPWILFEAGWAVGRLSTTVFGISLGLPLAKAISGPFAQFQNCEANEESLTGVVLQLIRRNPEARPREQAVRRQVSAFLAEIDPLIQQRKGTADETAAEMDATAVTKLFEEVKVMFRDLSDRVSRQSARPKRRKVHPMMIEQLFHDARVEGADPSTAWLLLSTTLREEVPWLAEPAAEVYRALRSASPSKIQRAEDHFRDVVRTMRHSRFMHFRNADDEDAFLMARHLPEMIEHFGFFQSKRRERENEPDRESGRAPLVAPAAKTANEGA
jgi:TIR domain